MRYLKYFLVFLLVLVVFFFAKGLLTPSISYNCEVEVDKTAAESWAVMTDESKMSEWITGYIRSEPVSGEGNTIGSVSNIYFEERGEEMVMQETITDVKINERMGMKFTMDFMDMEYVMSMKEMDGKTIIQSASTTVGNGLFSKSIISFMKGSMKEQEAKHLSNLKKLIEENTTEY